jgi:hypothetical protein
MGCDTHAIIDHRVTDYDNVDSTVKLLADSVPAGLAIEQYWASVDPESLRPEAKPWRPAKHYSPENLDYVGPGSLLVAFGPRALRISASARWSGFLTIKPLRDVHLAAFRSIANCAQGTRLLLLPEVSDVGFDAVNEALSVEECMIRLRQEYGPPQPSVEAIPPGAFTAHKPGSHCVWFSETV